ncbi:UDP-glucose/GDP-mannose dehydrogenase family protein, partial [Bacillus pseudomycoides]|uniref:UDP-glucose/GDP-mannose dehydrogenase family protein n=1 Tax=Bacillus pseudomycoides TaxID=64104 RepID=UPI000C00A72A
YLCTRTHNIPLLLEKGANIYAYGPIGIENFSKLYPEGKNGKGNITYSSKIEEVLSGAHICFIFTEWKVVKAIKPETYKSLMQVPLVFDGRNIYSVEHMEVASVEYHSVGRRPTIFNYLGEILISDLN